MDNYFENEILRIERELSQLKTAAQRSSSVIDTVSQTIPVSVPLSTNASQTICRGEIGYSLEADTNSILDITLDWYHQDVSLEWQVPRISRRIGVYKSELTDGKIGILVFAYGTNWSPDGSDDLSRLKRGESVSITANMTIQSTNNFVVRQIL